MTVCGAPLLWVFSLVWGRVRKGESLLLSQTPARRARGHGIQG